VPESNESDILSLLDSPAIRLFIDRAQAIVPDFTLSRHNAPAIATFCRALEGAPLAIELSAAWVQTLTPAQMTEKLHEKFAWIRARHEKDREARHQSLGATIAWSVDLLPQNLQNIFFSLSVFRGSFTAEAALAIANATLDDLARLRERSLLQNDLTSNESIRWRLLETIREFASENRAHFCEVDSIREAHLAYYANLAKQSYASKDMEVESTWRVLEANHDNLRAAFDYALATESMVALALGADMQPFWDGHGYTNEGTERLERAIAAAPNNKNAEEYVRATMSLGTFYMRQRHYDRAIQCLEKSLATATEQGYLLQIVNIYYLIGLVASGQEDYGKSDYYLTLSIDENKKLDNKNQMYSGLLALGNVRFKQKRYEESLEILQEVTHFFRVLQSDRHLLRALSTLAVTIETVEGIDAAMPYHYESLAICRRVGDVMNAHTTIINLAQIAVDREQYPNATRFYGLADTLLERLRVPRQKSVQTQYEKDMPLLRTILGANFDQHYQTGRNDDWRLYP
jgi:tetratricopeptide (TPR) repeat protein